MVCCIHHWHDLGDNWSQLYGCSQVDDALLVVALCPVGVLSGEALLAGVVAGATGAALSGKQEQTLFNDLRHWQEEIIEGKSIQ